MSFDWNNYLTIAEKIKSRAEGKSANGNNEALRRTAISRTYYSMFHLAVIYAKENLEYNPNTNGHNQAHSEIRGIYRRQFKNVEHQEVKQILSRLHKARIDCDYKDDNLGDLQALLSNLILDANRMKSILSS